ncbi:tautomerase family protein [Pannonibacter sp. Q-1]
MPLLKFHVIKGRTPEELNRLLDAAHDAMVGSFGVPQRDRYQILTEHEPSHLRALDTGLNITRTDKFLLLEVVSRKRTTAAKRAFYETLCASLEAECGVPRGDVMVSFTENEDEDWSFGYGEAQFLTGKL